MSSDFDTEQCLRVLTCWYEAGWLRALDLTLARFLLAESDADNQSEALVALLAALVSYQTGRGHVCLLLDELLADPIRCLHFPARLASHDSVIEKACQPQVVFQQFSLARIHTALSRSRCVETTGPECKTEQETEQARPLVVNGNAMYLRRYWQYEQRISQQLRSRMAQPMVYDIPATELHGLLQQLFPPLAPTNDNLPDTAVNWQKLACALAVRSRFCVITGGPGTGKTYTVVRLLALLQRMTQRITQHLADSPLRIRLAAPTGKAAARLKESVQSTLATMSQSTELQDWHSALELISSDSSTLHKLLGVQAGTRKFKHHAANRLTLDVLIIDEASMVDIEMMDAVLSALPEHAQLILLGDKDQLASVEAGAVLGQLCQGAEQGCYRQPVWQYLRDVSSEHVADSMRDDNGPAHLQHVMMLRTSRRFEQTSGIGQLAAAVNSGQVDSAIALLQPSFGYADITLIAAGSAPEPSSDPAAVITEQLRVLCREGFRSYWKVIEQHPSAEATDDELGQWARKVLDARSEFQLLSPLRDGLFGVDDLNQRIVRWLDFLPTKGLMTEGVSKEGQWYPGRPVMVTENDYTLNLRNGDIGIVLKSPRDGLLRAVFIDSDNKVRWILPSRLRQVETVFAMTVHKSQGSEFTHAVMVMPFNDSPVLSRELIYTGITRARRDLTMVVPDMLVFAESVKRVTLRAGGLDVS